ncbi:hypothetical protein [Rhodohalobacter sp. 614A]|uniref:hypothetical protein n=1 Tax=Rhodohalobacter sp. 614A TaxID=2908649 RepID=UPI001F2B94AB|nr:hypothetical protein [Rhodohalobacter sp. 614A]
MGQQQLLLVILVVIVVGISTIVAVNVLGIGADNANRDAMRQDLVTAASNIQPLWERPLMMSGAGRDFNNLTIGSILYRLNIPGELAIDSTSVENENGLYRVNIESSTSLSITGEPRSGGGNIEITVSRDSETNQWMYSISEQSASN